MNFTKLSDIERIAFLTLNNRDLSYDINLLFNELVEQNANTFTIPVVDLYIASKLIPGQKYLKEYVINNSQEFADSFGISNDISRILRILKLANLILLSIDEVLGMLENAVFYYEILTSRLVNEEVTTDSLHRHVLEDFEGYRTNSFQVHRNGLQQYLSMTLQIYEDVFYNEDYNDSPATPDNMRVAFAEYPEMISDEGKLIIPRTFEDSIYAEGDYDEWIDDVIFKFTKVSDPDLLEYITII